MSFFNRVFGSGAAGASAAPASSAAAVAAALVPPSPGNPFQPAFGASAAPPQYPHYGAGSGNGNGPSVGGAPMSGRWELLDENGPELASHSPANPFRDAANAAAAQPSARTYFSMTQHGGKLWVFGGFGDSKGRYNDLRAYDMAAGKWELIPPKGEVPRPVYLHTAVVWHNTMWIMGGSVGKDTNDLYAFDFATRSWRRVAPTDANAAAVPAARYGHAACVLGDHMLVTGGCRQNNVYFADTHLYHFPTNSWRQLAPIPLDLAYHALVADEAQQRVILVAGYNGARFNEHIFVFDMRAAMHGQSGAWTTMAVTAQPSSPLSSSGTRQPAASCGSAVVLAQNSLLFFGGYAATGHANDLFRLDLGTREWCVVDTPVGSRPVCRAYLQAALNAADGCFYIFGGWDGAKCTSDFRRIQLLPPDLNLFSLLHTLEPAQLAAIAVKHFGRSGALPPILDVRDARSVLHQSQLIVMFENLKCHYRRNAAAAAAAAAAASTPAAAASSSSSESGGSASSYPFDTSRLNDLVELGFTRSVCLACLEQMHARRQDTTNFSLVVDALLNFTPPDEEKTDVVRTPTAANGTAQQQQQQQQQQQLAPAIPPRPASASVASPTAGGGGLALPPSTNTSSLQDQVSRLVEENRELRLCKVCMEAQIDCVLMPCGHLVVCSDCADGLQKRQFECPAGRCAIESRIKIFWS